MTDSIDQCRVTMTECECCGREVPADEIEFVPLPNNAGTEAYACEQCREPPQWVREYLDRRTR